MRKIERTIIFAIVSLLLINACATDRRADTAPSTNEVAFQRLIPLSKGNRDLFYLYRPADLGMGDQKLEEAVASECGIDPVGDGVESVAVIAVIFGSLIKAGINLFFNSIENKLKKELEKHSAKYSAATWLNKSQLSELACFRFVRGVSTDAGDTVHMDLILGVEKVADTQGARIKPLRLYYGKQAPIRPSSNDKYGLAISMTTLNVTMNSKTKSPATLLLKGSFILKDKKTTVTYYNQPSGKYCKDDAVRAKHKLACPDGPQGQFVAIPVRTSTIPVAAVGVTVAVAEAGAPDKYLSMLTKLFSEAKADMSAGLGDLAVARLGFDD